MCPCSLATVINFYLTEDSMSRIAIETTASITVRLVRLQLKRFYRISRRFESCRFSPGGWLVDSVRKLCLIDSCNFVKNGFKYQLL